MHFSLVLGHVTVHVSATEIYSDPLSSPPSDAAGCTSWYSSLSLSVSVMKMPRLYAPGVTRTDVPVNFALIWS
jgi:hypothetical protein